MSTVQYMIGDATTPAGTGTKIIVHVCNDIGGWGAGFVLAISKRWKAPEKAFRQWYSNNDNPLPFQLGQVQFVEVDTDIVVANLVGQHGIRVSEGVPPIRYEAIELGLKRIAAEALRREASVHMPRIGCGLAGGQWSAIEPLIQQQLIAAGVAATVYDFPQST